MKRFEAGASQPTLDVIRKISQALRVSADLRLRFEAISRFEPEEKHVVRSLLDGMILKHEARRWSSPPVTLSGTSNGGGK